jgi:hypothetical protein
MEINVDAFKPWTGTVLLREPCVILALQLDSSYQYCDLVLRNIKDMLKKKNPVRHQWLTPIILATQEAEIKRIVVQSHPRKIVRETLP